MRCHVKSETPLISGLWVAEAKAKVLDVSNAIFSHISKSWLNPDLDLAPAPDQAICCLRRSGTGQKISALIYLRSVHLADKLDIWLLLFYFTNFVSTINRLTQIGQGAKQVMESILV